MNYGAAARQFSADEQDMLAEIVNIAMGRAGDRLARVLDSFVTLAAPQVHVVDVAAVRHVVRGLTAGEAGLVAVRQAFFGNPRGAAIAVYDRRSCRPLADLMGHGAGGAGPIEQEVLLDVSSMLIGACLGGIAEQIGAELGYSAPSLIAEGSGDACALDLDSAAWTHALLLEVRFVLEARGVACRLFILTPEDSFDLIRRALARMLDALR